MNREGWICTRCGTSLSPDVKQCTCAPIPAQLAPYQPVNPYDYTSPLWIDPTFIPTYPNPHPWWGWQVTCSTSDIKVTS